MSIVSDFARTMATQAFAMIGVESVMFGDVEIPCVLAEVDDGRDFSTGGFEVTKTITAVCKASSMPAVSILKKTVTARSQTFRVDSIRTGADFVTLTLTQTEKA